MKKIVSFECIDNITDIVIIRVICWANFGNMGIISNEKIILE